MARGMANEDLYCYPILKVYRSFSIEWEETMAEGGSKMKSRDTFLAQMSKSDLGGFLPVS